MEFRDVSFSWRKETGEPAEKPSEKEQIPDMASLVWNFAGSNLFIGRTTFFESFRNDPVIKSLYTNDKATACQSSNYSDNWNQWTTGIL